MKPLTRKEKLIDAIAQNKDSNITPITREESYLKSIQNGTDPPKKAITRIELFLDQIIKATKGSGSVDFLEGHRASDDKYYRVTLNNGIINLEEIEKPESGGLTPITREELILDKVAKGESIENAKTRTEIFWGNVVASGKGGTPSGITGESAEDGENYFVSVSKGELIFTLLPESIKVDTLPTKTEYNDGDTIDYSGMVVHAYTKKGNLWTDTNHPTGEIYIEELTLPETTAKKE